MHNIWQRFFWRQFCNAASELFSGQFRRPSHLHRRQDSPKALARSGRDRFSVCRPHISAIDIAGSPSRYSGGRWHGSSWQCAPLFAFPSAMRELCVVDSSAAVDQFPAVFCFGLPFDDILWSLHAWQVSILFPASTSFTPMASLCLTPPCPRLRGSEHSFVP